VLQTIKFVVKLYKYYYTSCPLIINRLFLMISQN